MDQIVDLENSPEFAALDVKLVNLATDSVPILTAAGSQWGVTTPLLSDSDQSVSEAYGVMRWATPGGEPSHTFVLVGEDGTVKWIQDYGHSTNGGRMYVPITELVNAISPHLQ